MGTTTLQTHLADAPRDPMVANDLHWWAEFETSIASGKHCIGLTFNTHDYVMTNDALPRPLVPHLYHYFKEQAYDLIVTYSLSTGIEIFELDADKESKFRRYSGLSTDLPEPKSNSQPIAPSAVLQGLNKLLSQDTLRVLVILNYGQHIAPTMQLGMASVASEDQISVIEVLHAWSLDNYVNTKTQNVVVAILREGQFHELLAEHWKIIRIDMPMQEDIHRFYAILSNLEKSGQPFATLEETITAEEAARASVGLRLRTIEEMSRRAAVKKQNVSLETIKAEKSREIQRLCGDVLEVLETNISFDDLAGLEYAKKFYRQIAEQVKRGSRNIPQGILAPGPPGCGKSFHIRAVANELGWNCLMMRAVRSMWVGESERNLERVLNTIQANLPAILFIDELDQMLGSRGQGGDAGTSDRMLARLWEFMALGEHRGKLIFVGASNRPDLLDPATVDRFTYVIPILQPTAEEFCGILPKVAAQLERHLADDMDSKKISLLLQQKGLSVRQVVDVVAMAALKSDLIGDTSGTLVSESALWETANNFRSNHNPAQIEAITLEAIRMTTFAELLPWYDAPELYPFPDYIRRVMDEKFEIDLPVLEKRLHELKQHLMYSKMMS